MTHTAARTSFKRVLLAATVLAAFATPALADSDDALSSSASPLPSGQFITPAAPRGAVFMALNPGLKDFPNYHAGEAVKTVVSPDGRTLLVMTSGYNLLADVKGNYAAANVNEYIFVFDISHPAPVQSQVIQIPNTYVGLTFSPDGQTFYASGGDNDVVHVYAKGGSAWAESGAPIPLGHATGVGFIGGGQQSPVVANIAVSADGKTMVTANIFNDSISVVDLAARAKIGELDLRPGIVDPAQSGVAGGETPFGVAIRGTTAYVSSQRDREVDVVDIATPAAPKLAARIKVQGNPNSMLLSKAGLLYVASDNTDIVSVIDTADNRVKESISVIAPQGLLSNPERFTGATPNALALSPDEQTLYVSDGGINAIAVVSVAHGGVHGVTGLIPTGWYPHSVSVSADGRTLYDVNGKSDPGANPLFNSPTGNFNQYVFQLEAAGLQALPMPDAAELRRLTRQVAANNGFSAPPNAHDEAVMGLLRQRVRHVIYIVKENRTYDQVLGDLDRGNGDPALALLGSKITPNQHRIAQKFVDLDNFLCSGEVSGNGWPWSEAARESDFGVKTIPLNYSGRGTPYDVETGQNRGADVGIATLAARQVADPRYPNDPNLLPGTNDDAATDGPEGARQTGYIWDSAFRAGLTVRNYGFQIDQNRYGSGDSAELPETPDPFTSKTVVSYVSTPSLRPVTDPYFRGYDNAFPDYYREAEWEREFDAYAAPGHDLPNLELVRLMHDHTGAFGTAIDGLDTPVKQTADNDYAVGRLIEHVAHSRFRDDTLIFIVEDDAQAGPDHVDAHRTIAFVAGPYVKHGAVVSTRYSTVNMLRTIEDLLGIDHLNVNDAYQRPMTDVFDLGQKSWTFAAAPSGILSTSGLPVAGFAAGTTGLHDPQTVAFWTKATQGYDWRGEDRIPAIAYNQLLWRALSPNLRYPALRDGRNYGLGRAEVLRTRSVRFNYE